MDPWLLVGIPVLGVQPAPRLREPTARPDRARRVAAARADHRRAQRGRPGRGPHHRRHPGRRAVLRRRGRGPIQLDGAAAPVRGGTGGITYDGARPARRPPPAPRPRAPGRPRPAASTSACSACASAARSALRAGAVHPAHLRLRAVHRVRNAQAYAELARVADEHAHAASHDALTGLANRRHLLDRGHRAARRTGTPTGVTALLLIDLNHFKEVNDTLGHAAGDQVLIEVADRLRRRPRTERPGRPPRRRRVRGAARRPARPRRRRPPRRGAPRRAARADRARRHADQRRGQRRHRHGPGQRRHGRAAAPRRRRDVPGETGRPADRHVRARPRHRRRRPAHARRRPAPRRRRAASSPSTSSRSSTSAAARYRRRGAGPLAPPRPRQLSTRCGSSRRSSAPGCCPRSPTRSSIRR